MSDGNGTGWCDHTVTSIELATFVGGSISTEVGRLADGFMCVEYDLVLKQWPSLGFRPFECCQGKATPSTNYASRRE